MLSTASQTQCQEQRALALDVAVCQRAAVGQLLAGPEQALLVGRDALSVLHLELDSLDRVCRNDVERDSPALWGLDEDLHV